MTTEILLWGSLLFWAITLILPWLPWRNREILNASADTTPTLDDITIVIPARNEADVIRRTLEGLYRQSNRLNVILVDDNSSDNTAAIASTSPLTNLKIIQGQALPPGWSGKLWAQHQGLEFVNTPLVLLLDADIYLEDGILGTLREKKQKEKLDFISLMAKPSLCRFWERALMPTFVYFFKLLYPFALSNSNNANFASAAGGCILLDTEVIQDIGGLQSIKTAIIDDCTLAKKVKAKGYRTWTGLTLSVRSQRPYGTLSEIWNMVARTAYTQLHYSPILLGLCSLIMALMFLTPLFVLFSTDPELTPIAMLVFSLMATTYLPTLLFYRRNLIWVFGLPLIAVLYLAMTWTSAWRYWNGEKSRWKNRIYGNDAVTEET